MAKRLPCAAATTTSAMFRFSFSGHLKNPTLQKRSLGWTSMEQSLIPPGLRCHRGAAPRSPFLRREDLLIYFAPALPESGNSFWWQFPLILLITSFFRNTAGPRITSFHLTSLPFVSEPTDDVKWGLATVRSGLDNWGYLSSTSRVPPALEWLCGNMKKFKDPV